MMLKVKYIYFKKLNSSYKLVTLNCKYVCMHGMHTTYMRNKYTHKIYNA